MFTMGAVVFVSILLIMIKLPHRLLLRLLNHCLLVDFSVSALVLFLHWGTFEGVMAATVAGLLTSIATSGARRLFGYWANGQYHQGYMRLNLGDK